MATQNTVVPVVTQVPKLEAETAIKASEKQMVILKPVETVPSNWDIVPQGDGIFAKNIQTGRTFEGSVEEFNKFIKA
jgi:hypothetical protein